MPPRRVMSGWPRTTPNVERLREPGSALAWPASTASTLGTRSRRSRCGLSSAPACIPSPPTVGAACVADLTDTHVRAATRLGAPFKVYAGEVSPFRVEVAKRIATRHGPPDSSRTSQSLRHFGRRSVPRWRGSSSEQSMAATRSMPARSPRPSPNSRVRAPRRLPAMT